MPLSTSRLYTTTGNMPSVNLDPSIAPFVASVSCALVSTGDFKMQFTLDPESVSDASATWFDTTQIPASTVANIAAVLTTPVTRVRLVIAANGSGIQLRILQGFSTN